MGSVSLKPEGRCLKDMSSSRPSKALCSSFLLSVSPWAVWWSWYGHQCPVSPFAKALKLLLEKGTFDQSLGSHLSIEVAEAKEIIRSCLWDCQSWQQRSGGIWKRDC